MGKGRRSSDQLKCGEKVTDRNFDYKEGKPWTAGKLKNHRVQETARDENDVFQEEKEELHSFRFQQTTSSRENCLESRIPWNNDTTGEADEPHYYMNESNNSIRSREDNDSLVSPPFQEPLRRRRVGRRVGLSSFWMSVTITVLGVTLILLTSNVDFVNSCNEAVCASIVSKCTLTQACKCELKNCSCCRECFECLTYLYDECCSCVELCPKPNTSHHAIMHSQVGDLKEPIEELFKALTEEKDIQGRWATFTFPIDIDQSWFMPKPEAASSANVYTVANGKIVVDPSKEVVTVNCTVGYMSECMPLNKCKNSCHSMGASYFRWFHDGCCECIGSTCINYGIDESRCTKCSMEDDAEDEVLPFDVPEVPEEDLAEGKELEI